MERFEQLVKALRCCAENFGCPIECPRYSPADEGVRACVSRLEKDAAAAIEALQAQLPKRVEIVRCKECIHFTQGGWCDREFDWFPVDKNDFCSMAEKMEAQDGK